ncbi:MAG: hypothetical protein OXC19_25975 [Bryobacterales bacterium]|nr:hypothetical protein [Bryobacterales bacterium]
MKNGFGRQFESLIRHRFHERDRRFVVRLVQVKQDYSSRGILMSSLTLRAMHEKLAQEFEESSVECVRAAVETMSGSPTLLPLPRKRRVLRVCLGVLSRRKEIVEEIFQEQTRTIRASLINHSMSAPYHSLSKGHCQLQFENARVELLAKHKELFWLRLNRMLKLFPLLKLRSLVIGLAAAVLYFGRFEIVGLWEDLHGLIVTAIQGSGAQPPRAPQP